MKARDIVACAWRDTMRCAGNDSPSRTRGFWDATDKLHSNFYRWGGGGKPVRGCVFAIALALDFVVRLAEEAQRASAHARRKPYVRFSFNDNYLRGK